ncbi:MAG: hypothetical protein KGO94_12930, partial [Alphaproteobacteria bacterium]|nr:hypothetical protein [Alphaproteobacteria bacterium]
MNFRIDFAPLLSWPLITGFALVCAVALAYLFWNKRRGTSLRLVTAALLLASLTNPVIRQDEREALPDIAAVVVDESPSQSYGQRTAQTKAALADLKSKLAALGNVELRVVTVSANQDGEGDGTRLFAALNKLEADIPKERFAGAFLITDGQVHDVPEALTGLQGPIHT